MPVSEYEFMLTIFGLVSIAVIVLLLLTLISKIHRQKQLQDLVDNLKRSVDEMDEQAKLIVRTDIELNKTQEDLDKKITGLYALQRLSRAISTTLEENQIFKKIEAGFLEDIGFEKALAFLWNEREKNFILYLNIGYPEDKTPLVKVFIDGHKDMYLDLIAHEKTLSSLFSVRHPLLENNLNEIFGVHSFVVSPILPAEGEKGFLFVGTESIDVLVTEGDEELINILANQVAQALENARLFAKAWQAQRKLEEKVEERTRELSLALEDVKKISQRKTDFVSSVSHELRTPLTSIKGYASILLAGRLGEVPAQIQERLEKINRHSDELVHLVNDLLDISRIESGKVVMKQELQDLKSMVEKISDLLSVQLKEKQLELSIEVRAEIDRVCVDREQIERVLINILGNAVKFTPPGGKIKIKAHNVDKAVEVDITDTGYGIPQEAQEAIFEEFYRVDNLVNQQIKGTGLGLALVKQIIEAHKGKVWVKSKVGKGSTFSFTLPISN
jgi:signal transduction histidine kinase